MHARIAWHYPWRWLQEGDAEGESTPATSASAHHTLSCSSPALTPHAHGAAGAASAASSGTLGACSDEDMADADVDGPGDHPPRQRKKGLLSKVRACNR